MLKFLSTTFFLLFTGNLLAQEALRPGEGRGSVRAVAGLYQEYCAVCHGERLEGAAQGTPLIGGELHATLAYGEPQARFDLANIRTTATRDGDSSQRVVVRKIYQQRVTSDCYERVEHSRVSFRASILFRIERERSECPRTARKRAAPFAW